MTRPSGVKSWSRRAKGSDGLIPVTASKVNRVSKANKVTLVLVVTLA